MMTCKRTVALLTLFSAVTTLALAQPTAEPARNPTSSDGGLTWTEVMECYRKPQEAIGCLESRMGRALLTLRDTAVRKARSDPNTSAEDVTHVGDFVQHIGEFIKYGLSSSFSTNNDEESDLTTDSDVVVGSSSNTGLEEDSGRAHKKKKIQKEIKKFVLKVLFGFYIFGQKIKMVLMSIQSILMSKFLLVAMLYALSNTFKIWWDIKYHKHHKHDKVVYYENAHHQHHYEPDHGDFEEHPHSYGSIWGRSIAVTEPGSVIEQSGVPIGPNSISRYVRRASQEPRAAAQGMAFNAQKPRAAQ